MSKDIIISTFKEDQRVCIIAGDFMDRYGTVVRLGAAGSIVYVHVLVDGLTNIYTFLERELRLFSTE